MEAEQRRVFHHVAGDGGVGLGGDADPETG
jgi:hypothetical protein